jgi:hypothetical protein
VLFAAAATVTGDRVGRHTAFAAQAVVGTLIIPATYALAALLGGVVPGLIAAAAMALYPPFLTATSVAGTEPLGALAIVLAAIALVVALRRGRPLWFGVAGAALALATLVRGDLVLAAIAMPLLTGAVWSRAHGARSGLAASGAMLAGVIMLLAPWSAFASARAHRFVPVTDGGSANLFIGTYLPGDGGIFGVKRHFAAATRRVHPRLRNVRTFRLPQQMVLDAVAARSPRRSRDAALRAAALQNLRDYAVGRPVAFAGMEARKLWRMWGGPYGGSLHRPGALVRWGHRLLVAAALAGLLAGLIVVRDRRLVLLSGFLAMVTVVDVAFVSEPRHNLRLIGVLVATGAAGGWLAVQRLRRSRAAPAKVA